MKSEQPGLKSGGKPEAIEDAATQICVGLGGIVQLFANHPQLLGKANVYRLMPTIFTTAKLWVSDAELQNSDILTGKIELASANFNQVDWLVLEYNISPGIKHSVNRVVSNQPLGDFMESEYTRSICIVNPSGLESFLRWAENVDLDFH